jgi:pimeloyl-ACP methyl ester carboxylesterase
LVEYLLAKGSRLLNVEGFEGAIAGRSLKPINGGQRGDHAAFLLALSKPHMSNVVAKAKVLYAVQEPFHKALLTGKTTEAAWRSKPSFYAVSTEDRTINPDLERFMAKRMGAKTIEVKASHLSLISQPDEITGLILEAAGQQA